MTRQLLALFAKRPTPGQVKTRLVPELGEEGAARFYEAMLLDIADLHRDTRADLALWFTPKDARPWFEANVPASYRLIAQEGPDLASRMRALFRTHTAEGYDHVVLRGTDSPTLPRERVDEAFAALEEHDLVLCPDLDGGYNLIGLCAACDQIFDIPMSTASVLDETLERARLAELRTHQLRSHHDVDTAADLELLRATDLTKAPRTHQWLREKWRP